MTPSSHRSPNDKGHAKVAANASTEIARRTRVKPEATHPLHDAKAKASDLDITKVEAKRQVVDLHLRLADLQRRLWAENTDGVLIVLQGLDTSGKDGTIRRVFEGINPQGVNVASFKVPTAAELAHDFLFRIHAKTPARGSISIFNRSHYEDLVVPLVYETLSDAEVRRRVHLVNGFEAYLSSQSIRVVKFFLHISADEQRDRLLKRLDDPKRHWKFSAADLDTRHRWKQFQDAYDHVIAETSTQYAPWHIIPANSKWYRDYLILHAIVATLESIDPRYPTADLDNIAELRARVLEPLN